MIWAQGYADGELRRPCLSRHARGAAPLDRGRSRGEHLFLRLGRRAEADLRPFDRRRPARGCLSGYFDTTTGPKRDGGSYTKIADALGLAPSRAAPVRLGHGAPKSMPRARPASAALLIDRDGQGRATSRLSGGGARHDPRRRPTRARSRRTADGKGVVHPRPAQAALGSANGSNCVATSMRPTVAIRDMWTRGAPLIGATAAYGLAHRARATSRADAGLDGAPMRAARRRGRPRSTCAGRSTRCRGAWRRCRPASAPRPRSARAAEICRRGCRAAAVRSAATASR